MKLDLSEVRTILKTTTGVAVASTDTPIPELGLDSVEIVGLIYEIDERYGVDLAGESSLIANIAKTSLNDLVTEVNRILADRARN